MEKLIETRDLVTEFNTFEGVVHALNGVSVVVNGGETYGLVGESGCGKSVAVRSMMRIVQAPGRIADGKVVIFFRAEDRSRGIDIVRRSEAYMESIRGDAISMIFQEASTSLNPVLSHRVPGRGELPFPPAGRRCSARPSTQSTASWRGDCRCRRGAGSACNGRCSAVSCAR